MLNAKVWVKGQRPKLWQASGHPLREASGFSHFQCEPANHLQLFLDPPPAAFIPSSCLLSKSHGVTV